jgi:hypothetical protein
MDRRRGARIPARFWVQVSGLDTEPVLRRGDISMSGAYVEIDSPVGPLGSVQTLMVAPYGRQESVLLLARVVRVVSIEDLWQDRGVAGVAFEFLPETESKRQTLTAIVDQVMASYSHVADSVRIDSGFEAQVALASEDRISVTTMVLDTTWPLPAGAPVRCELSASGRRAALTGHVTSVAVGDGSSRVEVGFDRLVPTASGDPEPPPVVARGPASPPVARSISDAVDTLLGEILFRDDAAIPGTGEPMHGSLERVRLAQLIRFLEEKHLSGVLRMRRDEWVAVLYLRDGRIVDAEVDPGPEEPRDVVLLVCSFTAGEFEFLPGPVERADSVGARIDELLATPS